jgi:hypothetical protein
MTMLAWPPGRSRFAAQSFGRQRGREDWRPSLRYDQERAELPSLASHSRSKDPNAIEFRSECGGISRDLSTMRLGRPRASSLA